MQPAYQQDPRGQKHSTQPLRSGQPRQAARPTGGTVPQSRRPKQGQARPQRPPLSPEQKQQLRKRRRRKRLIRRTVAIAIMAAILVGLVAGVVQLVRFFTKSEEAPPASSIAQPASEAEPASVAVSMPELALPVGSGLYDEAEAPPLFNFENDIPASYTAALLNGGMTDIGEGQQMESRAAQAYLDMSAAAKADGVTLVPLSGYRSNERQTSNYNASVQRYLDQGFSHDEAVRRTEGYYAIPGTSEHEAGLAIDIGDAKDASANIQDSFENTDAFAWLQEHCTEYGFILRYTEENFAITRIHYEPWHYRYVGSNHAAAITQQGVTLEEYVQAGNM